MKRFIFSLLFALLAFVGTQAQAQTFTMVRDTTVLLNAKTVNISIKVNSAFEYATFQLNLIRNSGTAAGTCTLQGSLDGFNWRNIGTDTLTIANSALQSHWWIVATASYTNYRIRCVGSGTQNVTPTGIALLRQK